MQKGTKIERLTLPVEVEKAKAARKLTLAGLSNVLEGPEIGLVFKDEYIRVYRDPVKFPTGQYSTYLRIEEHTIKPDGTSGVVIMPRCRNLLILQQIYRYPTQTWEWEFPRGFLESGLSPEAMARRELKEEMGFSVLRMKELGSIRSNTGLLSGSAKAFLADIKEAVSEGQPEINEGISRLKALTVADLWKMVAKGKIRDGFTLSALALGTSKGLLGKM